MDIEVKATLIFISVIIVLLYEGYKFYIKEEKKKKIPIINELTKDYFIDEFLKLHLSINHLKRMDQSRDLSPARSPEQEKKDKRRSGLFHHGEEPKDK